MGVYNFSIPPAPDGVASVSVMLGGMLLGGHRSAQAPARHVPAMVARGQHVTHASAGAAVATRITSQPQVHHQIASYLGSIPTHARHTAVQHQGQSHQSLPVPLYRLLDPTAPVDLPSYEKSPLQLDNRELDKLVAGLGRSKTTWRRALLLHQWLQECGHMPDARLATTLIRVCSQHGQTAAALELYDWMRATRSAAGDMLIPTVFTYTAAMRAALAGNLLQQAFQVWDDAMADGCEADCRMATTLIEVCARAGDTDRAIATYDMMRASPVSSRLTPSVHAYTAAMRAAAEGGSWQRALEMWDDMSQAGCRPTGHAFAAVISACAAGGDWRRGAALFDDMRNQWGIKPDVVSCTALVTAFGTDGQWSRAQQVIDWMLSSGIRPNVRTYTALIAALGRASQWTRAQRLLQDMRRGAPWAGAEPNAYTYSALLKSMGDQGQWQLAEAVFGELEDEALLAVDAANPPPNMNPASTPFGTAADGSSPWSTSNIDITALPLLHLPSSSNTSIHKCTEARMPVAGTNSSSNLSRASSTCSFNPLEVYGLIPTSLAEEVLDCPDGHHEECIAADLPDDLPGQSNCGASDPAEASFVSPTAPEPLPVSSATSASAVLTANSPSFQPAARLHQRSLIGHHQQQHHQQQQWQANHGCADMNPLQQARSSGKGSYRSPLNEVVCGTMMLALERAGQADKCLAVLERARRLSIPPNTVMFNTALSALAKAHRPVEAAALFRRISAPDLVSHETLVAAHGLVGNFQAAEGAIMAMYAAGFRPSDYAWCSLVAAYSLGGDVRSALAVRGRMAQAGVALSVHSYNALIAAAERGGAWDAGLALRTAMQADGILPNQVTRQLVTDIGRGGLSLVESQSVAVTALSAAVAAAGSLLVHTGAF